MELWSIWRIPRDEENLLKILNIEKKDNLDNDPLLQKLLKRVNKIEDPITSS